MMDMEDNNGDGFFEEETDDVERRVNLITFFYN